MITMYGFLEGLASLGGCEVTVTCQCGTCLLRHISATAEDARHDIGVTSLEQHELYRAHCAEQHQNEPFQVEWIDDPSNYQGVRQSDVEVLNWQENELSFLSDQFHKAFSTNQKHPPTTSKASADHEE